VPFDREVSVIAVRGSDGAFSTYPLAQNWHADGILSASLAPAPESSTLTDAAAGHARAIAEHLDYVGVFALELFVKDGRLLGNEMAPRVHNSGHWTIEGTACSQF
jgi:5-(carboxyamino)imidazole ribonucleotide synthase